MRSICSVFVAAVTPPRLQTSRFSPAINGSSGVTVLSQQPRPKVKSGVLLHAEFVVPCVYGAQVPALTAEHL